MCWPKRARSASTLTSYLAAAQMLAVWQETPALERGRAIAVGLPVNLRNYFPSDTARNFFNTIASPMSLPATRRSTPSRPSWTPS